jgi:transposase
MPWKASSVMDERLRFVARLLDGETMTELCRDFGISRKTGYKIFDRYKEHGLEALNDRSRRGRGGMAKRAADKHVAVVVTDTAGSERAPVCIDPHGSAKACETARRNYATAT